jgi:hypothetical protein
VALWRFHSTTLVLPESRKNQKLDLGNINGPGKPGRSVLRPYLTVPCHVSVPY